MARRLGGLKCMKKQSLAVRKIALNRYLYATKDLPALYVEQLNPEFHSDA